MNVAAVPLSEIAVAPVRLVPLIVTEDPTCPLPGLKLVMVGAGTLTVKSLAEVALPPGVVIEILPVAAPAGTAVVICVALLTVNVAAVPLNESAVAPVRFVPVTVTAVPIGPLDGCNAETVGTGGTVGEDGLGPEVLPPPHEAMADISAMTMTPNNGCARRISIQTTLPS